MIDIDRFLSIIAFRKVRKSFDSGLSITPCGPIYFTEKVDEVMRKIPIAPNYSDLFRKYSSEPEDLLKLLAMPIPEYPKYHHWDKIRYMDPPNGLNREQWWMAIKANRISRRKMLPFYDKNNNQFSYVLTDEIMRHLHVIDSKANGFIDKDSSFPSEEVRTRHTITSLVEEAIASSQLEGASITRKVASAMIRSGRNPRDRYERMILNNYFAMKRIQEQQSESLTVESLLNLHKILTESTMDDPDAAGRIQDENEKRIHVGDDYGKIFHIPPPAREFPKRLDALIQFANELPENSDSFIHPILRAIVMHFVIGYDHPFVDGNGRVARAVFYRSALRSGYEILAFASISQIINNAPAKYGYAYQYVETDENDLTYFIHHQLDVICKAISKLEDYTTKKQNEISRIEKKLKRMPLNYRQLALLSHAVRHPGYIYTIRSHRISHDCAYATARSDLMKLASGHLLEQKQIDQKTLGFIAPENLESQIDSGNT